MPGCHIRVLFHTWGRVALRCTEEVQGQDLLVREVYTWLASIYFCVLLEFFYHLSDISRLWVDGGFVICGCGLVVDMVFDFYYLLLSMMMIVHSIIYRGFVWNVCLWILCAVEIRKFEVRYVFDFFGVLFVKVCCFGNFLLWVVIDYCA